MYILDFTAPLQCYFEFGFTVEYCIFIVVITTGIISVIYIILIGWCAMSIIKGLEWTFNTQAEKYEKMRPSYVPKLYEDIVNYS